MRPLGRGNSFALGIEKPLTEITIPNVTNVTRYPDIILRYRYDGENGRVQIGTVLREIGGASSTMNAGATVFGTGIVLNGALQAWKCDPLVFGFTSGRGMARYISSTSGPGLDAAMHCSYHASGNLIWRPLPASAPGIEYIHGGLTQKGGAWASAARLQLSYK
jgi:hypothetical protein